MFKINIQCTDFRYLRFLLLGSAACPKEGTTNLHLDMSDAVNIMVSNMSLLQIYAA